MTASKNTKLMVVYGYGVEFLLAGLVFVLVWQCDWLVSVSKFVDNSAESWATFFGLMLAGAMAAQLVFLGLNTGEFSAWLEWKKLGGTFSGVFLFNLLLFFLVTATCTVLIYFKGTCLTTFGVFLGILGLINSTTFALFVYRLSRLQSLFSFEFKKSTEAEKQSNDEAKS
jgi:hypothetical protein